MSNSCDDEDVHREIAWMVPADVTALEFLYQLRDARGRFVIQTPNTVSANTGYSASHLSTRLQVLADHDLVEKVGHGEYRLTELGERAIAHEVPYEDLEEKKEEEE